MSGKAPAIVGVTIAWWFLVVLPGLLTVTDAFGHVGVNTVIPGKLIVSWLLFFCAQLGILYLLGHYVGHTPAWWFFVASLLPWAVDWAAPASRLFAVVFMAVAAGFAALMASLSLRTEHLDTHGTQVEATVVKLLPPFLHMNVVVNGVYIRRRVQVQFSLPGGQPQERTLGMLCEIGTGPSAGDHLTLRVDPQHPHHVAVDPSELNR